MEYAAWLSMCDAWLGKILDLIDEYDLTEPFSFTKGCRNVHRFGALLCDLKNEPAQEHPIDDPEIEGRMTQLLVKLMEHNDAPREQFEQLGLGQVKA